MDVLGAGTCEVDSRCGKSLLLTNVPFAHEIAHNLVRIRKMTECKHDVCFQGNDIYVQCHLFNVIINVNLNLLMTCACKYFIEF